MKHSHWHVEPGLHGHLLFGGYDIVDQFSCIMKVILLRKHFACRTTISLSEIFVNRDAPFTCVNVNSIRFWVSSLLNCWWKHSKEITSLVSKSIQAFIWPFLDNVVVPFRISCNLPVNLSCLCSFWWHPMNIKVIKLHSHTLVKQLKSKDGYFLDFIERCLE